MEVLVTGGNGLLGRHLVGDLLARSESVRILALHGEDTAEVEEAGAKVFRGDVRDPGSLAVAMSGVDAVVNLAGMMGVWRPIEDYRAVNVQGALNVGRAALDEGVTKVVHISSWTVYGMARGVECEEDAPFVPFPEPYALSKAEGDLAVRRLVAEEGLPAAIIRPGTFFGPGDRLHFARMAARIEAGRAIIVGSGRNLLPFVYVTDVARGIILALYSPAATGEAFNITTDHPLTQRQFLNAIAEELGVRAPVVKIPYRALYGVGHLAEVVSQRTSPDRQPPLTRLGVNVFGTENRHSIQKARRILGYEPQVSIADGIRQATDWYRREASPR